MSWRDQANCLGLAEIMCPDGRVSNATVSRARAVCNGCAVVTPCLEDALRVVTESDPTGVRGGLTAIERDRIRRRRNYEQRLRTGRRYLAVN